MRRGVEATGEVGSRYGDGCQGAWRPNISEVSSREVQRGEQVLQGAERVGEEERFRRACETKSIRHCPPPSPPPAGQ